MSFNLNFTGAINAIEEGLREGFNEVEKKMAPIIEMNTPVDTGALRKSERVDKIDSNGNIGLRFSANTEYALIQHENLNYQHTEGRAKYITAPLTEHMDDNLKIISNAVNRKLGG